MAEEDDEGLGNLGKDDVKTGVYEGGFKSWESSVDVVKVLHGRKEDVGFSGKVLEVRIIGDSWLMSRADETSWDVELLSLL